MRAPVRYSADEQNADYIEWLLEDFRILGWKSERVQAATEADRLFIDNLREKEIVRDLAWALWRTAGESYRFSQANPNIQKQAIRFLDNIWEETQKAREKSLEKHKAANT